MYVKEQLENGIRLVTEYRSDTRAIALGVLIEAGPGQDPDGKRGLAHLSQRMMFQGTQQRSALDIARMMDAAGGQMGGLTTPDYTLFYANVLDDYCTYAVELLGDLLLNSTVPEERFQRMQGRITREIKTQRHRPEQRVHELLKRAVWGEHPLAQPVLGKAQHVQALKPQDVRNFVESHYCPDKVIITAAGNVQHAEFVEQIGDALWSLQGVGPLSPRQHCTFEPQVVIGQDRIPRAHFALGIPAPRFGHPDRAVYELLNVLVGGGMSSRLFRRLREESGLVDHVKSQLLSYGRGGLLCIEGNAPLECVQQVLETIFDELQKLASGEMPVTVEELRTARMQLRGQYLLGGERMETRMRQLSSQQFYLDRIVPDNEFEQQLESVHGTRLQQLAASQLTTNPDTMGVAVLLPQFADDDVVRSLYETLGGVRC